MTTGIGMLEDRSVIVTGAAQGIGRQTALRAAAEGAHLTLVDRSELIADVRDEIADLVRARGWMDTRVEHVQVDLETWEGAEEAARTARQAHGRIDVSIHAVGGTIWSRPFEEYSAEKIQAEITRSLFPTLWMCRAVLPVMQQQQSGVIVNVSSIATRGINRVPYSAAKGGVNALTASLAMEAAPYGVRVVATAPGGTTAPARRIPRGPGAETDQEQAWSKQVVEQTVETTLLGRYGTLDEQAGPIIFLASDMASYITGTVMPVGGGDQG